MRKSPTTRGLVAAVIILLLILLTGYIEAWPAGQSCNWQSDCGYNERCKSLKYYERDDTSKTGICVPRDW